MSFTFRLGQTLRMYCYSLLKVLLNQCINGALVAHCQCWCRPTAFNLVSSPCLTTLKMPDLISHCTHISSMLPIHTVQKPINFHGTNLFSSKKFNHCCFLHVSIRFAILNCLCIALM